MYLRLLNKIKKRFILLSLFVFFSPPSGATNIVANYEVLWNSVLLGNIEWQYYFNDSEYRFTIELNSSGITKLYPFYGKYVSYGSLEENSFHTHNYSAIWKTKKKNKFVKIKFDKGRVVSFSMGPEKGRKPRIDFLKLNNATDPITASLELIMLDDGRLINNVFDGRRTYNLSAIKKNDGGYLLKLNNYQNIWKDHNKTDLKSIEVTTGIVEGGIRLPLNFKIKNKRLVFKINYISHKLIKQ